MVQGAITFDFHNTLASCDDWFHLEVRCLVSDFMRWRSLGRGETPDPAALHAADDAYRRLRRAILVHGHELAAERCVATVLEALDLRPKPAEIKQGVERLMRETLVSAAAMDGAVETIRQLATVGVPLAVVSSAVYHPFLEWTLDRFGIRDAFTLIATSAATGYYKSRPEIFWHASERLGVQPARCVHVGDSYRFDVDGARRAGMRAVWVSRGAAVPNGHAFPPDLTVQDLVASARPILSLL